MKNNGNRGYGGWFIFWLFVVFFIILFAVGLVGCRNNKTGAGAGLGFNVGLDANLGANFGADVGTGEEVVMLKTQENFF